MIISASRRTDIPSYYSEWFFNRIKEGFVCVRNPVNFQQVSKINLSPDVVDGIVFWTKNPTPMLDRIKELDKYTYYFQFTLNAYARNIERNLPSKEDVIIPTFIKLSSMIGKERVVWRYDPIFFNKFYTPEFHKRQFEILCEKLSGYTEKCTVSFVDLYKNTMKNTENLGIKAPTESEIIELMTYFVSIAKKNGIYIDTCAEKYDLSSLGVGHAHCVDAQRLERIGGYNLFEIGKDKNQRAECGCVESIDIGMYNTCKNGCAYCYANFDSSSANKNYFRHDINSPLICGNIEPTDKVSERTVYSNIDTQLKLF